MVIGGTERYTSDSKLKFEYQNPKSETISNDKNTNDKNRFGFGKFEF